MPLCFVVTRSTILLRDVKRFTYSHTISTIISINMLITEWPLMLSSTSGCFMMAIWKSTISLADPATMSPSHLSLRVQGAEPRPSQAALFCVGCPQFSRLYSCCSVWMPNEVGQTHISTPLWASFLRLQPKKPFSKKNSLEFTDKIQWQNWRKYIQPNRFNQSLFFVMFVFTCLLPEQGDIRNGLFSHFNST